MFENNVFFLGARSASVGPRGVRQPPAAWEKAPKAGQGASWAERSALSPARRRRDANPGILRGASGAQAPLRPARGSCAPLEGGGGRACRERTSCHVAPRPLVWRCVEGGMGPVDRALCPLAAGPTGSCPQPKLGRLRAAPASPWVLPRARAGWEWREFRSASCKTCSQWERKSEWLPASPKSVDSATD